MNRVNVWAAAVVGVAAGATAQTPGLPEPLPVAVGPAIRVSDVYHRADASPAIAASPSGRVVVSLGDITTFTQSPVGFPTQQAMLIANASLPSPTPSFVRFRGSLLPPGSDGVNWGPGAQEQACATSDPNTGRMWIGGVARPGVLAQPRQFTPCGIYVSRSEASGTPALATPVWVVRSDAISSNCIEGYQPIAKTYQMPRMAHGATTITDTADGVLYCSFVEIDVCIDQGSGGEVFWQKRLMVSRSFDGGSTWSIPIFTGVLYPNGGDMPYYPTPLVLTNGRLVVTYSEASRRGTMFSIWSDDEGLTWSTPSIISADPTDQIQSLVAMGDVQCDAIIPLAATAARSPLVRGNGVNDIFAIFPRATLDGSVPPQLDRVSLFVKRSTDGGQTWGDEVALPLMPDVLGLNNTYSDQISPAIAVDSLGGVIVSWWQSDQAFNNCHGPNRRVPFRFWYARIHNYATTSMVIRTPPVPLSTIEVGPDDVTQPFGLGEYHWMTAVGQRVYIAVPLGMGSTLQPPSSGPCGVWLHRIDFELP